MKILKFGGTSIGTPKNLRKSADIILKDTYYKKIVVLSALSQVTDCLVQLGIAIKKKEILYFKELLIKLRNRHIAFSRELFDKAFTFSKARNFIESIYFFIETLYNSPSDSEIEKILLAQGEFLSTYIFDLYLKEKKIDALLLPALVFMKTIGGKPDEEFIKRRLNEEISKHNIIKIFLTQGFICMDENGRIDNLGRGGSDYTASLIGAAVDAQEIQIWTDIDGIHNNDPRIVRNTSPIHFLSFNEAAELAYFGAKILHPAAILPAKRANIPVLLRNTLNLKSTGTFISKEHTISGEVKAITSKSGVIAIKIQSSETLLAYEFLREIFQVVENYKTPIDMVTISEIGISFIIDDDSIYLKKIISELTRWEDVKIDKNQAIIYIIGHFLQEQTRLMIVILKALKNIPILRISYGGNKSSISILVQEQNKAEALHILQKTLFSRKQISAV